MKSLDIPLIHAAGESIDLYRVSIYPSQTSSSSPSASSYSLPFELTSPLILINKTGAVTLESTNIFFFTLTTNTDTNQSFEAPVICGFLRTRKHLMLRETIHHHRVTSQRGEETKATPPTHITHSSVRSSCGVCGGALLLVFERHQMYMSGRFDFIMLVIFLDAKVDNRPYIGQTGQQT